MKIPLNWLKEYIDFNISPSQIAKVLTSAGLEVVKIDSAPLSFDQVVVVKVLEVQKHPDSDKLCIAQVTNGVEKFQVVCGAPNCREGIKTALATVGAILVDGDGKQFKVKKSKIRGVESWGMLCSAKELQLSENHESIIEFADHIQEGTNVASIYGDIIFEISLTPNLGHCASVFGVARELSAMLDLPLKTIRTQLEEGKTSVTSLVDVKVHDLIRCPRYACRVIKGVKIAPSPEWLRNRLIACDIRPINNVVDATNYVLMELGHPLHAFDYDTLDGHEIIVRSSHEGESFITLDDKEHTLSSEDLLICDKSKPIALAGIMGGANSEVNNETVNILIESAYFLGNTIRRTSKRQAVSTDASKRFERGTDPNQILQSLERAAVLILQIAGGDLAHGVIDVKQEEFPEKQIVCRLAKINGLLGTHLGLSEVENIIHKLKMHYESDGNDQVRVKVPTYRVDIQAEIDMIEEVARIYGYDNIPEQRPRFNSSLLPHAPIFIFEREIRNILLKEGLQEFLNCDLIGPTSMGIIGKNPMPEEAVVRVLNPVSIEQSILRTSLLPGLLQSVKFNYAHQNHDLRGFEIGRIHFKEGEQYKEQSMAAIILTGKRCQDHWASPGENVDFFYLKGALENLFEALKITKVVYRPNNWDFFHIGRQASIYVDTLEVGSMGEIHPAIQRRLDIPQRILFAELNLHDIFKLRKQGERMKEMSILPASERDWTVSLSDAVPIQEVFDMINVSKSLLLEKISLLAIYRSEKLGKGVKNATFRFLYRDNKQTIDQQTVDNEHARIIEHCLQNLTIPSI